jgi:hypothetical protein
MCTPPCQRLSSHGTKCQTKGGGEERVEAHGNPMMASKQTKQTNTFLIYIYIYIYISNFKSVANLNTYSTFDTPFKNA